MRTAAACLCALVALAAAPAAAQYVPPAPAATTPGAPPPAAEPQGADIALSLPEAVALGLRQNRQIRSAYLDRTLQKFDTLLSETRFEPKLQGVTIGASRDWRATPATGTTISDDVNVGVTPVIRWDLPTGGSLTTGTSVTHSMVRGAAAARDGSTSWTVDLTQPLLKGGGLEVGMAPLRKARLGEKSNILALKGTVSGQVKAIIDAYYTLVLAQQNRVIARNGLERARNLMEVNRALIAAGRMADNEIFQTETNIANQEFAVLRADNDFTAARRALLTLLGLEPTANVIPGEEVVAEPLTVNLEQARTLAFENNPDYLRQLIGLEQSKIDMMLSENARLWDLDLTVGHTESRDGATTLGRYGGQADAAGTSVGLNLTIPLDRRPIQRDSLAAKIALQKAEWAVDDAREAVEKGVRDAVRNVDVFWRQLELARRARVLAEQTLEVEMVKLRNGRTSNFQLLSVEDSLRQAEQQELSAVIAYLGALATLDQQLGTTLDTWSISLND
ncbi:TolC family protein [Novispirillum sp. DQ9]|uniref:TolC family protein n=1 Tax=Novispirillum sp. DQ9 TaxID=3398612 RepID=UPI003C7B1DF5